MLIPAQICEQFQVVSTRQLPNFKFFYDFFHSKMRVTKFISYLNWKCFGVIIALLKIILNSCFGHNFELILHIVHLPSAYYTLIGEWQEKQNGLALRIRTFCYLRHFLIWSVYEKKDRPPNWLNLEYFMKKVHKSNFIHDRKSQKNTETQKINTKQVSIRAARMN